MAKLSIVKTYHQVYLLYCKSSHCVWVLLLLSVFTGTRINWSRFSQWFRTLAIYVSKQIGTLSKWKIKFYVLIGNEPKSLKILNTLNAKCEAVAVISIKKISIGYAIAFKQLKSFDLSDDWQWSPRLLDNVFQSRVSENFIHQIFGQCCF